MNVLPMLFYVFLFALANALASTTGTSAHNILRTTWCLSSPLTLGDGQDWKRCWQIHSSGSWVVLLVLKFGSCSGTEKLIGASDDATFD